MHFLISKILGDLILFLQWLVLFCRTLVIWTFNGRLFIFRPFFKEPGLERASLLETGF